jgi:hypothetical protein
LVPRYGVASLADCQGLPVVLIAALHGKLSNLDRSVPLQHPPPDKIMTKSCIFYISSTNPMMLEIKFPVYSAKDLGFKWLPITLHVLDQRL